ncbi:AraC family transcriptional regulator [Kineococcus gynurae]|uniref:AraC family transcriptional regulator n=1 Tax=Kineococcus gynurae TaxID=452979 RepID=A0ABV5LQY6_9ACTN
MSDLTPGEPWVEPQRIELDPVPLAVLRAERATLADLPRLFDTGYRRLGALPAAGVELAGPAVAVYRGDPQGVFDLEIGFPLQVPLERALPGAAGESDVVASVLPAGPAVAVSHLGGYEGLGAAWVRLLEKSGAEPAGTFVEVYVSDPSQPGTPRTDLLLPLGRPGGASRPDGGTRVRPPG